MRAPAKYNVSLSSDVIPVSFRQVTPHVEVLICGYDPLAAGSRKCERLFLDNLESS